ncbi:MAG: hypothetical protein WB511_04895 [Nitrososphaeraceae archaeon]
MKIFASVVSVLILCIGLLENLEIANAQGNSTHYDMKSVIDNLNKSITRLTGGNSELLKDTIAFINKISYQMANQSEDIRDKDSLNTAEPIAKKIGVGFAEVLSNISGELKQGIGSN